MRLRDFPPLPKNLTIGAIADKKLWRIYGCEIARECRELGVQTGFSPVVDINTNPANPVIHMRSFGDDPDQVFQRAEAVIEGMQDGGLWTCLKHFPGHGDTEIDSHKGLPMIKKDLTQLNKEEFYPYRKLIEKGNVDMIMVGHLLFPALDPEWPASLSEEIISGLLRKKWGFQKVVITDALNMRALIDHYPFETIILRAFKSGADLFLSAASDPKAIDEILDYGIDRAIKIIKEACEKKEIQEEEIDQKLHRIHHLMKKKLPQIPLAKPGIKKHLFQHAITKIGVFSSFPIGSEIALIQPKGDSFAKKLQKYARVHCFSYDELSKAESFSYVIIQVNRQYIPPYIPQNAIVALFDSPYLLQELPKQASVLLAYEEQEEAKEALVEVLFGQIPALGKLPVKVSRN